MESLNRTSMELKHRRDGTFRQRGLWFESHLYGIETIDAVLYAGFW